MQFSQRAKPSTEETLGRLAASALCSSLLMLGAFFLFVFASISHNWWVAPTSAAVLALYIVQAYYLTKIGRFSAKRRVHIWQASLVAHLLVLAAAWLVIQESIVFILLLPECLSAIAHVFGMRLASRALSA